MDGRDEKYIQYFGWKTRRKGDHLEVIGVDGKIILERILGKQGRRMWTGFMWLRIGTSV